MTDVIAAPIATPIVRESSVVTLENVRAVSTTRSASLGFAVVVVGLIELVKFALLTSGSLESTIQLTDDNANAIPSLGIAPQVLMGIVGTVAIAGGVLVILRHRATTGVLLAAVGAFLIAFVANLSNSNDALKFTLPGTGTAWLLGPVTAQVLVGILGAVVIAGGVFLHRRLRSAGASVAVVGAFLVAWPVALAVNVNGPGDMLKNLTLPVTGTAWVIGGVTLALGIAVVATRSARAAYPAFFVAMALFILEFLVWVARGSNLSGLDLSLTSILALTFISATPLIFGSLSGVVCERAGVVNIAIEGQFMVGALGSAMMTSYIGATTFGFVSGTLVAAALGAIIGVILAYMALHFRANQIIVGVVIVAICTALVQFVVNQVLNSSQNLNLGYGTQPIAIRGLSDIPIVGPVLFEQTYFIYLAIALVAIVNVVLFRTRWGLRVRSVGETPKAAETVGLSVTRIRFLTVVIGGAIAGIGGAAFTIGQGNQMGVGITGGKGFIALAIMIFGRWRPWGAFSAALLFGFTIAIGSQYGIYEAQFGVPDQLIQALPYLITIAAVAGLVGRVRPPAADGLPYFRE